MQPAGPLGGTLTCELSQSLSHVPPEGGLGVLDSLRDAVVDVGDRRLQVVGRAPEAGSTPSARPQQSQRASA
jgi:hypothetical protein